MHGEDEKFKHSVGWEVSREENTQIKMDLRNTGGRG
jgi:hypothetical protein